MHIYIIYIYIYIYTYIYIYIYISRTSNFDESNDPVYNVFENKVLHRCLSRILSTEFIEIALKEC